MWKTKLNFVLPFRSLSNMRVQWNEFTQKVSKNDENTAFWHILQCYILETELEFLRSFQRGALFKVRRVDATRKPWLFYLENLVGKPVEDKSYYAEVKVQSETGMQCYSNHANCAFTGTEAISRGTAAQHDFRGAIYKGNQARGRQNTVPCFVQRLPEEHGSVDFQR